MSETVIEQPRSGWYPDPSVEAAYRWWDGDRWSLRTTQDPERSDEPLLPFAAPWPSRRTLRGHEVAGVAVVRGVGAADAHGVGAAAARASIAGAAAAAAPSAAAGFVPLNPLVSRMATAASTGFVAPESWIENSPATTDHAVYGTGTPFTATMRPDSPAPVNSYANLGAGFAVIGLLYQVVIVVWGPAAATSYSGLAVAAALVAGVVLGVLGMVRAGRFAPRGTRPQRAPGLLVTLVCLVALAAQVAVAIGVVVPTGIHVAHLPLDLRFGLGFGSGLGSGFGAGFGFGFLGDLAGGLGS